MTRPAHLRIGELAARAGVSVATIKFYIRDGLLPPPPVKTGRTMAYYDQEISDAVDASALELDLEPRIQAVQDLQRLIMQKDAPAINLYSGVSFGARWAWYKGLVEGRGSFGGFNGKAWIDSTMRES